MRCSGHSLVKTHLSLTTGLPLHGMDERDFWHGDEAIQVRFIHCEIDFTSEDVLSPIVLCIILQCVWLSSAGCVQL